METYCANASLQNNSYESMKNIIIFLFILLSSLQVDAQNFVKNQKSESSWDQGVPVLPEDPYVMGLIDKIGFDNLRKTKKNISKEEAKICRELGVSFYDKGMYDAADWYLERVKGYTEVVELEPEVVFEQPKPEPKEEIPADIASSLAADKAFLENLPKSYDNVSPSDLKKLASQIESQLQKLIEEKEKLIKENASQEVLDAKDATINTLGKEKKIIDLSIDKDKLKVNLLGLEYDKSLLKKFLLGAVSAIIISILIIVALSQRKTIKVQDEEIDRQLSDINKKNTYLEYAARIIRHDMHSGINTYIPRGLNSLQKRISDEVVSDLKIGPSIKMIKEGLAHTQKVYKNVYEFTNLVKVKSDFNKKEINLKDSLEQYLSNTSYFSQVEIDDLGEIEANSQLICNAIDNLIKNGLKYNKKEQKLVRIYKLENSIIIEDNGDGLSVDKFNELIDKGISTESESGIGLNITKAIVEEHGFSISCEDVAEGTKIKINFNND
jgi:signal transduction histidine kinase